MQLFRVFSWDGSSPGRAEGGPLHVARARQGAGRHDAPSRYGAWYCSRLAVSAIAESIQFLRGQSMRKADFTRAGGIAKAIVTLQVDEDLTIVDLDDPAELVKRRLRPSQVATQRRQTTQRLAASLFDEGAGGLAWWSTLDAEWANVTLFHERALPHVSMVSAPRRLSVRDRDVQAAAERLGIRI